MVNMDKKVILVVPPCKDNSAVFPEQEYRQDTRELRMYPPLGLAYLAGELVSSGIPCEIIDAVALSLNSQETSSLIFSKNPSVVGVTVTSFTLQAARALIQELKKIAPALPVVVGGPHVTYWPEAVSDLGADYGILGDAEVSFRELVESLSGQGPALSGIRGLWAKNDSFGVINNGLAVIQDFDSLSFPARKLLPEKKYLFIMNHLGKFATMITARGCLFDCVYCGIPHKKQLYLRSVKNILRELDELAADGYKYINFIDDCFTLNRDRTVDLCGQILKNKIQISWGCSTRADYVDDELLGIMKKAGCYDIRFGVESGVERIRQFSIGKHVSDEVFKQSFQAAKRAGLITAGFFIFGHPQETLQDMHQTVSFAKKLNPHYAVFMLATPIPGSRLFGLSLKEGKFAADIWKKVSLNQEPLPIYAPGKVTVTDMKILQGKASLGFYLRPASLMLKLKEIKRPQELFFKFRIGMLFLIKSLIKYLKFSKDMWKTRLLCWGRRFVLPHSKNLEELGIPLLDKHTKLIYHPFTGILYQKRFCMVFSYLRERRAKILEVGCGRGLLLPELSKRCFQLHGIDIHGRLDVVQRTLEKERLHNVFLSGGNITAIPYRDRVFDAIICVSVLEHLKDLKTCFTELSRVLKDSGDLILGFPVKNGLTDLLFRFLRCDVDNIHPSSHQKIILAAREQFSLQSFQVYPRHFPVDLALYFVGRFAKR